MQDEEKGQIHDDEEKVQVHHDEEKGQVHDDEEKGQVHDDEEKVQVHDDDEKGQVHDDDEKEKELDRKVSKFIERRYHGLLIQYYELPDSDEEESQELRRKREDLSAKIRKEGRRVREFANQVRKEMDLPEEE
jgi:hypothetical protein